MLTSEHFNSALAELTAPNAAHDNTAAPAAAPKRRKGKRVAHPEAPPTDAPVAKDFVDRCKQFARFWTDFENLRGGRTAVENYTNWTKHCPSEIVDSVRTKSRGTKQLRATLAHEMVALRHAIGGRIITEKSASLYVGFRTKAILAFPNGLNSDADVAKFTLIWNGNDSKVDDNGNAKIKTAPTADSMSSRIAQACKLFAKRFPKDIAMLTDKCAKAGFAVTQN